VPTTTKPRKLSPAMTEALGEFWNYRSTQGGAGTGIILDWVLGKVGTRVALQERGMVTATKAFNRGYGASHYTQITAAGCEATGHTMDEIVAWAYDAAMKEYAERCTAEPDSWYNPMTDLPIAVGAVVEIANSGVRGTITSRYQDNWWIHGANDSDRRCVSTRGLVHLRVIELAPPTDTRPSADEAYDAAIEEYAARCTSPTPEGGYNLMTTVQCGRVDEHEAHDWPNIVRGGTFACQGIHVAVVPEATSAFESAPPARTYIGHDTYSLRPRYPAGTPEHTAYAAELRTELTKFAAGEPPYEYEEAGPAADRYRAPDDFGGLPHATRTEFGPIDKTAIISRRIDSLLNSGVTQVEAEPANMLRQVANGIEAGLVTPAGIFPGGISFDMQFSTDTVAEVNRWAARLRLSELAPTTDHHTWVCWETRGDFYGLPVTLWCAVKKEVTYSTKDIVDAEVVDETPKADAIDFQPNLTKAGYPPLNGV
jgi:hypothetical protein